MPFINVIIIIQLTRLLNGTNMFPLKHKNFIITITTTGLAVIITSTECLKNFIIATIFVKENVGQVINVIFVFIVP
jgi:hypothetical protein